MYRIGYQVGTYPAKSETWIRLEVESLKSLGYEVKVATFKNKMSLRDCDFIVAHFATVSAFANAHGRPYVLIPHANDIWPHDGYHVKFSISHCSNLMAIGCISTYHRDRYLDWGVPTAMLIDWPCAVDVDLFTTDTCCMGDKVIAGGRNVEKKGLGTALAAWPDVVLFGDHPQSVGWLQPAELKALMEDSWCYLGTFQKASNGDMDGLPIAVLEALSMGRQVVTTEVAGLTDLAGLVRFTENDPAMIAAAIRDAPHEFNGDGASYVRERHNPLSVAKRVLALAALHARG